MEAKIVGLRRIFFITFAVLCVSTFLWGIWVWSAWMVENDKRDFAETCEILGGETHTELKDWICIKDGKVVYG